MFSSERVIRFDMNDLLLVKSFLLFGRSGAAEAGREELLEGLVDLEVALLLLSPVGDLSLIDLDIPENILDEVLALKRVVKDTVYRLRVREVNVIPVAQADRFILDYGIIAFDYFRIDHTQLAVELVG